MSLAAWSIEIEPSIERERAIRGLWDSGRPLLVLDTCQRLEVFGRPGSIEDFPVSEEWKDVVAFERLARIAAGLESRVLGEFEVLGQVREAYRRFHSDAERDLTLDRFFQDAIALARKARRKSHIDRDVTSLSALAGREILGRVEPGAPIAVIGSGSLASSVIRHLGKRGNSPVRVSSRCPENAVSLAARVGGFGAGLDELVPLLRDVSGIVCATAAPHPVVYADHIKETQRPLHIIDLGVPPDCHDEVIQLDDVDYTALEDVEARAQVNLEERNRRSEIAARIIRDGAIVWARQRR